MVDAAELLRLYLNYDLLEEAVDLVLEYVDALLGKGPHYFGIEVQLGVQFIPLYFLQMRKSDGMYLA